MTIDRTTFLELLAQRSQALDLIFLNHIGPPSKLLSDISTIDLLSDKKSKNAFIEYCHSHPLVKGLVVSPQFKKTNILVEFQDGSELSFRLISNIVQKTLLCLDVKEIRKSAFVNEFGMLIPSKEYHFEYLILQSLFSKDPISERYKNYFSGFESSARAVIFKYIQIRYNLIFNTLEDLYAPKPNMTLAIIIGLRAEPENTLLKMFLRSIEQLFFNLFRRLFKKDVFIPSSPVHASGNLSSGKKRSAGQALL